jgi:uncharacterized protein YjbI with pentapeptide repeats
MAPLFQRLFPAVEEEERPKAVPEAVGVVSTEAEDTAMAEPATTEPAAEAVAETKAPTVIHVVESRDEMIHASKLPPAADTLAQLFAEGPAVKADRATTPEVATTSPLWTAEIPAGTKESAPKKPGLLARLFRSKRAAKDTTVAMDPGGEQPQPELASAATIDTTADTAVAVAFEIETAEAEGIDARTDSPLQDEVSYITATPAAPFESLVLAEIPDIHAPMARSALPAPEVEIEPISAERLPSAVEELEKLFASERTPVVAEVERTHAAIDENDSVVTEESSVEQSEQESVEEFTEELAEEVPVGVEAIAAATNSIAHDSEAIEPANFAAFSDAALNESTEQISGAEIRGAIRTGNSEPKISLEAAREVARLSESPIAPIPNEPASVEAGTIEHAHSLLASPDVAADDSETGEIEVAASKSAARTEPQRLYKDWAFDEKLASHAEWAESHGRLGQRADLSGAELEASDLISVNLRLADLHDANLRASDLLLADLRDACLVRADLEEACLVGANLEGANLEGASLETAMGLVPRQFAGANLRDALLAPHLMEFDAVTAFARESKNAFRYFSMMTGASVLSWLLIAKTRDAQLLTDSAIIPFLHSRAAAAALPTAEAYLIVPVAIFVLYVLFHFHLQRLWDSVVELPAIFPDGHTLGDSGPGIISGLLRTHFRWMNPDPSSTRLVEKSASLAAAYGIVPITLLLFWIRYLTRQEIHGTILQAMLATTAAGMALYATLKSGKPQERWAFENKWANRAIAKIKAINPISAAACLAVLLLLLSGGVIFGVPHDRARAPQFGLASVRRWAPDAFFWMAYDPYPDLTEASISRRPAGWNGSDGQVASVDGMRANNAKFRYAQAYGAFFANAHLWRADFQGAFLSEADFRDADLGQSNLRFAVMDHAQLNHANLDRSNLDGADLRRADLREANLSYTSLENAILVDARMDSASLYTAKAVGATLTRAVLEKADLREAYLVGAHMDHADLRNAYLWSARLPGADLGGAQLQNAIFIDADLDGANLGGAMLTGTVMNGAVLTGTSLEGADLRGALGLSAGQICSARSRRGLMLDTDMETQVESACGKQ